MSRLSRQARLRLALYSFYALIAILPVIVFISVFNTSLHYAIEREIEIQAQLAVKSLDILHSSLQYADAYTNALSSTGYLQSYVSSPASPGNHLVSRMLTMHDAFPILTDQTHLIDRVYIYSRSSDSIIDRYSGYLDLKLHYEKIFRLGDMTQEEWKSRVLQSQDGPVFLQTLDEKGQDVILYSRPLPVYPITGGRIIFYLDGRQFHSLMSGSDTEDLFRSIALYDDKGSLLYTNTNRTPQEKDNLYTRYAHITGHLEVSGDDGKQILFSSTLPDYGLTLYTGMRKAYFINHALHMSAKTLWNTLPLTLLSLFLLFFIVRYSHQPLREAIDFAQGSPDIKTWNPFKYVQQSIMYLSDVNQRQIQMLQVSRSEMQEAVLSMLVYRKKIPSFPLEEKLAEYGIVYNADCFCALILMIRDPDSNGFLPVSSQMHMLILDLVRKASSRIHYIKMDGPEQMLFLALLDDVPGRTKELHDCLSHLCWELNQAFNSDVRICIGAETNTLEEVYYSFKTARELMLVHGNGNNGYLIFSDVPARSPIYDYTGEDARFLRQKASTGDADAVKARLLDLLARNSGENARSAFERQLMYSHMIRTLIDSGYQDALPGELTRNLSEVPLDHFFDLLSGAYTSLCVQNRYSEQQEEQQQITALMDEIRTHLGDYELTQTKLAIRFGLTERKVAAIVLDQTGMTFSKYLEKLRIDKAKELLQDGTKTVEAIALEVGYGSDKSFRRAFKKVTNCPPSAYKE